MGLVIVIILGIFLNIAGAVISKFLALNLESIYIAIALAGSLGLVYVARIKFWVTVSRMYQLSYVYPLLSVSYLVSFGMGIWVFHEAFSITKLIGSLIIVAGVVIVSRSQHKKDTP